MTWFIYAIISSFCASLATILEKKVLQKEHTSVFSASLSVVAALTTLPFLFVYNPRIPLEALSFMIVASILATIAFVEVTKGIRHLEISSSAPLFLLSPLITTVLAFIFLGETLTRLQLFGMLLLLIGAYVLQTRSVTDFKDFWSHITGDIYVKLILIGLALYGVTSLIDRIVLHRYQIEPLVYVAYLQLFIAINFIILTYVQRKSLQSIAQSFRDSGAGIVLVAFLTTGYRVAQSMATALAYVGLVIAIKRSSSLFTTIIGGEIFHEKDLFRKTIACMIMIVGVVCVALT
jgi:drug/metabolite transporter (DMT)-like permease